MGYDSDDRGCIVGENVGKIVGVGAVVEDEVLELVGWDLLEEYGIEEAGGIEVDLSLFLEEGDVGGELGHRHENCWTRSWGHFVLNQQRRHLQRGVDDAREFFQTTPRNVYFSGDQVEP